MQEEIEKKREKTGGRQKGTPNKRTKELAEALGSFDPIGKLKKIYKETQDQNLKAKICLDLMKYLYPQRKAIDIETSKETGFQIIVADEKHKQMLEEL